MIDQISLITAYPESILFAMACLIAIVDLGVKTPLRGATYGLTLLTLAVVALLEALYASGGATTYGFGHMVVSDSMGNWLKCFATVAVMVTLVYGRPYAGDRDMLRGGELFTLSLFALLGMFVMISGNNFLVLYWVWNCSRCPAMPWWRCVVTMWLPPKPLSNTSCWGPWLPVFCSTVCPCSTVLPVRSISRPCSRRLPPVMCSTRC